MSTAIALMLLTGLLWAGVGVLFGAAPAERDRLYPFFALNGILFNVFVFAMQPPAAAPAGEVLRLAAPVVPSAAMEVAAFLLLKFAMDRGSQGVAWCVAQSAMAVSFVCSVVFLHNPATTARWTGLALALAALVLFARGKPSKGSVGNDARYFRLVFASFALIGAAQFLRLLPGYMGFSEETLSWRLPLQAPFGAIVWTAVCFAGKLRPSAAVWKLAVPYAAVVAASQIVFDRAVDAADALRATSLVMPVSIGTCILLFALWCRFFRGERLSRGGWTAVALDIAGIALLSCP